MKNEDNVLHHIFGKEHTDELVKFSNMVKTIGSRERKGGLVENYLALHPIANLGRLVRLKIMGHLLADKLIVKYFVSGMKTAKGINVPGAIFGVPARLQAQLGAQRSQVGLSMIDEAFDRAIEAAGESGILEKLQGIDIGQ